MARITAIRAAQLAGLGLAAAATYYVVRRGVGGIAAAAGEAAVDAAKGVVIGIGKGVGIPETNVDACTRAINEGRMWDASFACPAGTFLKSVVGIKPPPSVDQSILDPRDARARQLNGVECGCGKWSPEAWIGLAALGATIFIHARSRRAHGRQ